MARNVQQLFLDDFRAGQIFTGASRHITEADVLAFAALTGDKHPIHYDDDYAKATRFGRPIVHGLHLMALTALGAAPLSQQLEESMVAMLEQRAAFLWPVFKDDVVRSEFEIESAEPRLDKDWGTLGIKVRLINQRDEVVLEGCHVYRRRRGAGRGVKVAKPSYAEAVAGFDWSTVLRDLGWHDGEAIDLPHTIVDRHADAERAALHWVGRDGSAVTVSYRELRALSNRIANLLRGLGVRQGDRVAGVLPRVPETIAVMIGTWKAGAVYVPVFTGFGPVAIAFRLHNSGARVVVTHRDCRDRVTDTDNVAVVTIAGSEDAGLRPGDVDFHALIAAQSDNCVSISCSRRDAAVILYTSGSTGEPKGVAIAANFLAATRPYMQFGVDLKPGDRFWPTGDPGWGYGFVCYHAALAMGVPVLSYEAAPTPRDFLQFLQDQRVTNVATVPTLLRGVMALGLKELARYDLRLRAISSCGEPLNSEVIRFFQEGLGLVPRDHFGSSENGLPLGNFNALEADVKPGSMGLPMPGFAMTIVNDDGRELPPGEVGYLAQHPGDDGCYALGYWQDEERSKKLFRHRFIIAGDMAHRDASGYFWFEGRADDVIKSSAYRVGPFEVESAILHHPAIAEAAVVGKPDALKGHIVKAYVTLRPGQSAGVTLAADIQVLVRRMVGDHAYPREVEVVDSLPKTESGKIQRFKLRAGR